MKYLKYFTSISETPHHTHTHNKLFRSRDVSFASITIRLLLPVLPLLLRRLDILPIDELFPVSVGFKEISVFKFAPNNIYQTLTFSPH